MCQENIAGEKDIVSTVVCRYDLSRGTIMQGSETDSESFYR